jgi:hypothetical protein
MNFMKHGVYIGLMVFLIGGCAANPGVKPGLQGAGAADGGLRAEAPLEILPTLAEYSPPKLAEPEPLVIQDPSLLEEARRAARVLTRSNSRRDYPSDGVFANFREINLGGIAPHTLYRSRHPADGDVRSPYAARLAEQARITVILNLSDSGSELTEYASYIPWYQNFINKNSIIALQMDDFYTGPEFAEKLRSGLRFIISHNKPYLIHSREGLERTGTVLVILEALMGASVEEILSDYMASYVNYYKLSPEDERYGVISRIPEDLLTEINRGKSLKEMDTQGAAEIWLLEVIGLSGFEIETLKVKLGQ